MMNKFKLSVLTIFLLSISLLRMLRLMSGAYEKWEVTQFVAVSGHQPKIMFLQIIIGK